MEENIKKKLELVGFGDKLKILRSEKGKSQKWVAGELKVKPSTLSSYEIGDREPPFVTLNKIARYYNVTVDYLTGNNEFKTIEVAPLSDLSIFTKETLDKMYKWNDIDKQIFNKLMCSNEFINFIRQLILYGSTPAHVFVEYAKTFPSALFGVSATPVEIKHQFLKPEIDKDVDKTLKFIENYFNEGMV